MEPTNQLKLIPDEPLSTTLKRIPISSIDEGGMVGSRRPSASMIESVSQFGVMSPVWISPLTEADSVKLAAGQEGRFKLLAGRRRILAAQEAGILMLNAVEFPYGTTPGEALLLIENEQRSENPLIELEAIEKIIQQGGTMQDICEACGIDRRRAEARMRLQNLIPEFRQALVDNRMAVGVAEEAARLPQELQRKVLEGVQESGAKIRGKDISAARRVRQGDVASALPSALFGSKDEPPAPSVEDGSADTAAISPGGFTVAFMPVNGRIDTIAQAEAAARAIIRFASSVGQLSEIMEVAGKLAGLLSEAVQTLETADPFADMTADPENLPDGEETPEATEGGSGWVTPVPSAVIVGASGKAIKPESARKAERRKAAKEKGGMAPTEPGQEAGPESPPDTMGDF